MNPEITNHLEGFIKAFILPERRSGWESALLKKTKKAANHLRKFERHLVESRCQLIESPEELLLEIGSEKCVYWDGFEDPTFSTCREVASTWCYKDAIVSVSKGSFVVFLFHEGWGWKCSI